MWSVRMSPPLRLLGEIHTAGLAHPSAEMRLCYIMLKTGSWSGLASESNSRLADGVAGS